MKKQTISKIAAVALAAMSVVPMFGVTASADAIVNPPSTAAGGKKTMSGTAYKIYWVTSIKTVTRTLRANSDGTRTIVVNESVDTLHDNFATPDTIVISGVSCNLAGKKYYTKAQYEPDDYRQLVASVKANDAANKIAKDEFEKAVNDYNTDITAYNTAYQKAINSAPVTAGDDAGLCVTTFTDSKKQTVTIRVNPANGAVTSYKLKSGADWYFPADPATVSFTSAGTLTYNEYNVIVERNANLSMSQLANELGQEVEVTNGVITNTGAKDVVIQVTNDIGTGQNSSSSGSGNGSTLTPDSPSSGSSGGTLTPDNPGATIMSSAYYSSTYPWYSSYTRRYYRTYEDAVYVSPNSSYVSSGSSTTSYDSSSTVSSTYPYYSSLTGRYYRTWETAVAASGNNSSYVTYAYSTSVSSSSTYSSTYPWYSSYTRRYYRTYADAVSVSPNSSYVSNGNYYNDPYYYLGLNGLNGLNTTSTTSSSSSKSTSSTVTVGGSQGWSAVTKALGNAKSGSEITVNMNKETTIPADVMSALQGKNVTVDFKLSNGATYAINGTSVSSTGSVNVATTYGTKNIPSSIVSKAVKANSGVSSAQFSVSNGSLGANAAVTVKVSDKRAGNSAKLYRYDASSNSLTLVSKSAVQSTGKVEFTNVKQGGNYVIVLS